MERFRARQIVIEPGRQGQSSMIAEARTPLILLLTITGFVLLIACANIANLLLARGASRSSEMAVRRALGGGRRQVLGQLLTESVLLALLGGGAGLVVARWTLGIIGTLLPPDGVQTVELGIQPSVILFTGVLAVGTGILFGLYPAVHATRPDLISVLRVSSAQPSGSRGAQRYRNALVTGQFALSMALLVGAGLFIRSLVNVSRVDLGIRTEGIVQFGIAPSLNGYEPAVSQDLFNRTLARLDAVPSVTSTSSAMVAVLAGNSWGTSVSVEGFAWEPGVDAGTRYNEVGAGYFATLGIPLIAGREFTDSDVLGAPKVAVVNEAFTRKFNLDRRNAIGKYMAANSSDADELDIQIVGVVQDSRYNNVRNEMPPLMYLPWMQDESLGFLTFYARTDIDPSEVMGAVPELVSELDPNLPVNNIITLEDQIRDNVFLDRLISTLSAGFALLATVLAAIGLYGVLAYTVAQRTREIGVRMALGAGQAHVRRMVLRQVSRLTIVGGVIGLVGAYFLGRGAQSLLYEMEGNDPVVFGGVALFLAGVALAAGYLPARRAARVDPMEALRYE
jgi:predicted permease